MQLAILNTSILTGYGEFRYVPLSLEDAQNIAQTANAGYGVGRCRVGRWRVLLGSALAFGNISN